MLIVKLLAIPVGCVAVFGFWRLITKDLPEPTPRSFDDDPLWRWGCQKAPAQPVKTKASSREEK